MSSVTFSEQLYNVNERTRNRSKHPTVNLADNVFKDESGKPWVFPVVRRLESKMPAETSADMFSWPLEENEFERRATALLLGEESPAIEHKMTVGRVGGLRLAAEFCKNVLHLTSVVVPDFSLGDYHGIFHSAGFFSIFSYPRWNTRHVESLLDILNGVEMGSVVLLESFDGSFPGPWKHLATVCQNRRLFVILESCPQEVILGDSDKDGQVVRQLVNSSLEMLVVQSFSENCGLYDEQIGNLCVVTGDKSGQMAKTIRCRLVELAGHLGLIPPSYGAKIVTDILRDEGLREEWRENLQTALRRVEEMRWLLYTKLTDRRLSEHWDSIRYPTGIFAHTPLRASQIKHLKKEYGIHLPRNGRISLPALNMKNIDYVANAICDVVGSLPEDSKL